MAGRHLGHVAWVDLDRCREGVRVGRLAQFGNETVESGLAGTTAGDGEESGFVTEDLEHVGDPGGHRNDVPGRHLEGVVAEPESDLALDHVEDLVLLVVHVQRGAEPTRGPELGGTHPRGCVAGGDLEAGQVVEEEAALAVAGADRRKVFHSHCVGCCCCCGVAHVGRMRHHPFERLSIPAQPIISSIVAGSTPNSTMAAA